MKDYIKYIAIAIIVVLIFVVISKEKTLGGFAPTNTSYQTASSTAYTIGHQLSTKVLDQFGRRGYASFCNTGSNRAYLSFSSTSVTATTSASVSIATNTCFEINQDNLYVGEVQALQETGTTTATFLVTELRY